MTDAETHEKLYYPGFSVMCLKCGGTKVSIENTLGYSAESGAWGSVDLQCEECGYSVEICEP